MNTTAAINSLSGAHFSLTSFDVAGFYGLLTPPTLQVVGFRPDGTTVTNSFTPANSFQTFHFDSGFVGLNSVRMNGGFAFDNLVVGIPEPMVARLVLLAALCVLGRLRTKNRRSVQRFK